MEEPENFDWKGPFHPLTIKQAILLFVGLGAFSACFTLALAHLRMG